MDEVTRRVALARQALATLAEALDQPKSALARDAGIQRFEYSFEATWKATQRFLREAEGVEAASPAAAIRSAHAVGLVDEPRARLALDMLRDRNLTAHTYNEALAKEIFARLPSYARLLGDWIQALEDRARR